MTSNTGTHFLRCLMAAASIYALAASAVRAQTPGGGAQEVYIGAQPLDEALVETGRVFGVVVVAPASLTAGKTAPAVSGDLTAQETIDALLAGSGLVVSRTPNDGFVLAEAQAIASPRAAAQEFLSSDEIIVFGAKEELTVQQLTASADVFTVERIEKESLFDLGDLLARTPNVTGSASTLVIRGVNRSGFIGTGSLGVTSNIYIDSAPASLTSLRGGFNSLWDVAQTEVLRGPQSAIQGRNALAGGVFITTNDPTYKWEANARIRYGSFNTQQYAGVISGPLIKDQVAFRLAGDYQSRDGFIDSARTGEEDVNFSERFVLRGKLLIEPQRVDGLRIEAIAEYAEADNGAADLVIAPVTIESPDFEGFDFRDRQSFIEPRINDAETLRLIGDITYDFSEALQLRFIGTYEDADSIRVEGDLENLAQFPDSVVIQNTGETYTGEAQLLYKFERWSGIFGAYYFDDSGADIARSALPLGVLSPFPVTPADSLLLVSTEFQGFNRNFAFFTNARFEMTDRWTLSFGMRYDNERVEQLSLPSSDFAVFPENCSLTAPGAVVGVPLPFVNVPCVDGAILLAAQQPVDPDREVSFDAFLPRGSITYHISDDISVFFSAQRGYRAGGTFLQQNLDQTVAVGVFDPEFLTNYEIGLRSILLDRRLRLNGNLFYSLYKDQQVRIPGPSGGFLDFQIVNAGRTRVYGLEMTADFQVSDALNLFASVGLLDSEIRNFAFARPGAPFDNLAGNEAPDAAAVSFTAGASYEHPSGWFADGSIHFRSGAQSDIFNLEEDDLAGFGPGLTEHIGSSALANLRIGYRHDRFTLSGYVTNLFDDDTPTNIELANVNSTTGAIAPQSEPTFGLREPRVFGVVLDLSL